MSADIKTVLKDERAEFIKWITYTYPKTYTVEDADHYWRMEHVSALAWKARAVLEAAPAFATVSMIDAALAEGNDYHDLRARLIELLAAPASSALAMQAVDANIEANVDLLRQRAAVGLKKYGVTTDRTDLNAQDWIQHTIEELLDGANYLQALRKILQSQQSPVQASEDKRQQVGEAINRFFSAADNGDGTFAFDPFDARDVDALMHSIGIDVSTTQQASDAGRQG